MTAQFVILLRGSDRAEEFLPYIEAIARPGLKIIFLVHYGLTEFTELVGQIGASQSSLVAGVEPAACADHDHNGSALLHHGLSNLRQRGVELSVRVYSGGSRRAARRFVRDHQANVLMISRGEGCALMRWLRRQTWLKNIFKSNGAPAVLMVRR